MSQEIEVEWPDFGVTVTIALLDNENPKLCGRLWQALPFETVFMTNMSPGEMFIVPIPAALYSPPEEKLAFVPDEPPGTVFSFSGLACLFIKYGTVVEPFRVPKIGRFPEEELGKLRGIYEAIRDAYFFTKNVNVANWRRKV